MKVHCAHDKLVSLKDLKAFPKNPNRHSPEQIDRLAKILEYQGWRYPVKVSKLSGFVTSGHGRIMAAEKLGWKKVPVNYQEYKDEEQEYADVVADNAIADWSELDLGAVNTELGNLGPDFDLEMLGLKDFLLEPAEKTSYQNEWAGMPEFELEDQKGYQRIVVHFLDKKSVDKFSELVRQPISEKTLAIWYPGQESTKVKGEMEYISES